MQDKPAYLKLNLKASEAHRLSWNGQYFNIEAILFFDHKIESKEQARQNLEHCSRIRKHTLKRSERCFAFIFGNIFLP